MARSSTPSLNAVVQSGETLSFPTIRPDMAGPEGGTSGNTAFGNTAFGNTAFGNTAFGTNPSRRARDARVGLCLSFADRRERAIDWLLIGALFAMSAASTLAMILAPQPFGALALLLATWCLALREFSGLLRHDRPVFATLRQARRRTGSDKALDPLPNTSVCEEVLATLSGHVRRRDVPGADCALIDALDPREDVSMRFYCDLDLLEMRRPNAVHIILTGCKTGIRIRLDGGPIFEPVAAWRRRTGLALPIVDADRIYVRTKKAGAPTAHEVASGRLARYRRGQIS